MPALPQRADGPPVPPVAATIRPGLSTAHAVIREHAVEVHHHRGDVTGRACALSAL